MCLPNFERFDTISEDNPLIGYRTWRNSIRKDSNDINILKSESQDYKWSIIEGPHEVKESDSGIYAYYNCNNYCNNYNNNYNYNCNNYYAINGVIHQWGKVAMQ